MKLEFESNSSFQSSAVANEFTADSASSSGKDVALMMQAGVKAAQEGNRREARVLLLQAAEAAPNNENVWLWLASISDYPEELMISLNNVLKINPHNTHASEWACATKSLLANNFVQRGVDAFNEAQTDLARQCFLQALVHDDRNEMAWFRLASISDSADEKISYLHKVLSINPKHETALNALQTAKSQIAESLLRKANTAAVDGEGETANEILQTILKQTPELEQAWILKSHLTGSFSDKIVCFEKVLSINPENTMAMSGLASLKQIMAQTENKKSADLVADFPTDAPEETQPQTEFSASEQADESDWELEGTVEDTEFGFEDIPEPQPAPEMEDEHVAPQPTYSLTETETDNYRAESFRSTNFASEPDDTPTAEAEEVYEAATPQNYADYFAPEINDTLTDIHLDFDSEAAPFADDFADD